MAGNRTNPTRPAVFCDFDGTITQGDVTDRILEELAAPDWRALEDEWVRGRIGSRECLERQMALVDASEDQINALIDAVPIDPGFAGFYRFTRARRIPLYVVSDGFDYIIRRVLRRSGMEGPLENGSHLFSSALQVQNRRLSASFPAPPCEHGCATCKAEVIERIGRAYDPVIFVGDGLSDRYAIGLAEIVFAKNQLLDYCRNHDLACRPFETFADIQAALSDSATSREMETGKHLTPRSQGAEPGGVARRYSGEK